MNLLEQLISNGEEITMFGDSELYMSPQCTKVTQEISALRRSLLARCGQELEELLDEYTEAVESMEDLVAEHYFEQGFLAGRRDSKRERD